MNKNITIWTVTLILLVGIVTATGSIYWVTPSTSGEKINTYPQKIVAQVDSDATIGMCTFNINGITYNRYIGTSNATIRYDAREGDGTNTLNLTCNDGTTITSTTTYVTDEFLIFHEKREKEYSQSILYIIYLIVLAIWIWAKKIEKEIKMFLSGTMLLLGYAMTINETSIFMWIPVAAALILLLTDIVNLVNR